MSNEDYAKYLVKGSAIVFGSMVAAAVIGIILRILLARALSPEDYGLLFAVIAFVSFFTIFSHLGVRGALTKFISEFRAEKKLDEIKSTILTGFGIMTVAAVLLSLTFIALSEFLSQSFFGTPSAKPVLIILAIWFVATMTQNFLRSTFQGFRDMVGHSGIRLARMIFTLGLVTIAIFLVDSGVVGIALAYLFGSILSSLVFFVLLRRKHSQLLKGDGSISRSHAKKLLSFGLPLLLAGVSGTLIGWTDTLMLTEFRSLEGVGFYQVARPLTQFLGYFGMAISIPFFPMVSEIWAKGERKTLRSVLHLLVKFSVILIIPAALVFLAFPGTVIRLLFGAKYLQATTALQVLSVGTVFLVGSRIFGPVLTGTGRPRLYLKASGGAAIFNVFANLILVPPYGAGGAAIATSISLLIMLILCFYFVRGIIGFPVPIPDILKALTGGGLVLLMVTGLKTIVVLPPWPAFFVVIVPSLLFYIVWILRTGGVTRKDLNIVEKVTPIPRQLIKVVKRLTIK
ncbi:hypothetical protein AKJ44_01680 [candidate division MSBL1 archaeon SCGC-AAA261F17]|uniref:Uncharacterized protein n=1 Tax=candidate division MSBL1 archaeon SCGC-AAA261F17 TaxID=1698274 RepID=A0A133V6D4_9EURY|nr:hypothetical protein AKJ44_01680 [candidate division MSBL1 archaeon SCGC-AAA261F17]